MTVNRKFLKGYSWPVPVEFSDALEFMTLAQGDVFYSHEDAYIKEWGEALLSLRSSIQILASFPIGPKIAFYESSSEGNHSREIKEEVVSYDELRSILSSWPAVPLLKNNEDFIKRWNRQGLKKGDAFYEKLKPYELGDKGLEFALQNSIKAIEVIIPFEYELQVAIFRPNQRKTALELVEKKTMYYFELKNLLKGQQEVVLI